MTTLTSQQQLTVGATPEGWTAALPFQQFDPSLGTLMGVQILVNGTLSGSISLENLGSAAGTVAVGLPGGFDLSLGDLNLGGFAFNSGTAATLGAYDGTKDYAGSSGTVIYGTFGVGGLTTSVNDAPHLAQFTGTGTVDLSLTSAGSSEVLGDAALNSLLNINTGGVVTLQYQYVPPGEAATSSGAALLDFVSAIFPTGEFSGSVQFASAQTTAAQTVRLPDQISGWSTVATVNKFDPALGSLVEVLVTVREDLAGTVAVENLSAEGWRIGFDQSSTVSVTPPGTDALAVATLFDDSTSSLNLGAYDGTKDFAGLSGTVVSFSSADPLAQSIAGGGGLTDATDLAAFTGAGTIALQVSSTGLSDMIGPPDLLAQVAQTTGATISVSYVYDTSPGPPDIISDGFSDAVPGGLSAPTGARATSALPTFIACFAAGTRITTPKGAVAVERLCAQQLLVAGFGGQQRISWIGRRRVDCRRHPNPDSVMPVRIAAHAFGLGRPKRPILLSPDHSVFIEGVLIPIKFLVNGHTITQIEVDSITYYHVELPRHDVVLAEGLPVESYLETGGRGSFENGGGPIALHPSFAVPNLATRNVTADEARVAAIWRQNACAPLLGNDGELDRARLKVLLQAQLLASKKPVRQTRRATSRVA
jgi:Hint domain